MNDLVSMVKFKLKGKSKINFRLPLWMGMILGHIADGVSKLIGVNFPVSAIRIKNLLPPHNLKALSRVLMGLCPLFLN